MTMFSTKYPNNIRTVTGTPLLKNDDVVLECDTTLGPVTINLLGIPGGNWNTPWRLYIIDKAPGNASVNNITINAGLGQKINNSASVIINVTGGGALVRILDNTNFLADLNYCCGGAPQIPAYIHAYVEQDVSQFVPSLAPVLWTAFSIKKNIDLINPGPGLSDIKIESPGIFEFSLQSTGAYVVGAPANQSRIYRLFKNAVALPGTMATNMDQAPLPVPPPIQGIGKIVAMGLFSAVANDIIQLRNVAPWADEIRGNTGPISPTDGAMIKIHKIDDL